jgi:uncharacterized protein YndB with AHSA1/START domain
MIRRMGTKAEIDPQPGGMYRLDPNGRDVIRGKYLEVIPDSRVVFTWGWQEPGHRVPVGSTSVEIDLQAEGNGTRLRLGNAIHVVLILEDSREFPDDLLVPFFLHDEIPPR